MIRICCEYAEVDKLVYGPGGPSEDNPCSCGYCPYTGYEHEAGLCGKSARAAEVRRCSGPCRRYFHKLCMPVNGLTEDPESMDEICWKLG